MPPEQRLRNLPQTIILHLEEGQLEGDTSATATAPAAVAAGSPAAAAASPDTAGGLGAGCCLLLLPLKGAFNLQLREGDQKRSAYKLR